MSEPRSLSVFVLEDEPLIHMLLTDMTEDLGHRVVADAATITEALTMAESAEFDLAFLDVNIAGRTSDDVAAIVARRGLPLIFITGYDTKGLPEGFRDRPMIQKPFTSDGLKAAIDQALR
jgi:CheY-like chemotaxis protein